MNLVWHENLCAESVDLHFTAIVNEGKSELCFIRLGQVDWFFFSFLYSWYNICTLEISATQCTVRMQTPAE